MCQGILHQVSCNLYCEWRKFQWVMLNEEALCPMMSLTTASSAHFWDSLSFTIIWWIWLCVLFKDCFMVYQTHRHIIYLCVCLANGVRLCLCVWYKLLAAVEETAGSVIYSDRLTQTYRMVSVTAPASTDWLCGWLKV